MSVRADIAQEQTGVFEGNKILENHLIVDVSVVDSSSHAHL